MASTSLPSPEQRRWLDESLTELVDLCGAETLLAAPLVEPTAVFFPDAWAPTMRGVRALAERLLAFAGLGDRTVVVVARDDPEETSVLWLIQYADGVCRLGVDVARLAETESVAPIVAREVARAWRFHHGLLAADPERAEHLLDVTTVYLGFGVLTVNAAHRYRAEGELRGNSTITRWSHTHLGALSPTEMSYVLALQAVARRLDGPARRHLRAQLETNQAAYFGAACKLLDGEGGVGERLGLPQALPPPRPLPPPPQAPDLDDDDDALDEPLEAVEIAPNQNRPIFRVRRHRARRGAFLGLMVALPLTLFGGSNELGSFGAQLLALLAGPIAGGLVGRSRRWTMCSDPSCEQPLDDRLLVCPRCGGVISGIIDHPNDRLAAEEELEERRLLERPPYR